MDKKRELAQLGLSQLLSLARFLPHWDCFSGFVNFINSKDERMQFVLFADGPRTSEVEPFREPQHGLEAENGFPG